MKAKKKDGEKEKMPKVDKVSQEKILKAKKELEAYLKKKKLDPSKDWSKDKKHGEIVKPLMGTINLNRKKLKENTAPEKHHSKKDDKKKPVAKKEKVTGKSVTKYDYPLVDGREMTSDEKKKYRIKMRKEANPNKPKKDTKEKVSKKETKVEKKTVKSKDKDKKKKKVKSKND